MSTISDIQAKSLYFLSNVQVGAQVYITNGLEGPPNEKEVFVFSSPLSSIPSTLKVFPQITKSFLKILFN